MSLFICERVTQTVIDLQCGTIIDGIAHEIVELQPTKKHTLDERLFSESVCICN